MIFSTPDVVADSPTSAGGNEPVDHPFARAGQPRTVYGGVLLVVEPVSSQSKNAEFWPPLCRGRNVDIV